MVGGGGIACGGARGTECMIAGGSLAGIGAGGGARVLRVEEDPHAEGGLRAAVDPHAEGGLMVPDKAFWPSETCLDPADPSGVGVTGLYPDTDDPVLCATSLVLYLDGFPASVVATDGVDPNGFEFPLILIGGLDLDMDALDRIRLTGDTCDPLCCRFNVLVVPLGFDLYTGKPNPPFQF